MLSQVLLFLQVWSHLYEAVSVCKMPYVCCRKEENVGFLKGSAYMFCFPNIANKCEISFLIDTLPGTFGYCSQVALEMSLWKQGILILCFSNPFYSTQTYTSNSVFFLTFLWFHQDLRTLCHCQSDH